MAAAASARQQTCWYWSAARSCRRPAPAVTRGADARCHVRISNSREAHSGRCSGLTGKGVVFAAVVRHAPRPAASAPPSRKRACPYVSCAAWLLPASASDSERAPEAVRRTSTRAPDSRDSRAGALTQARARHAGGGHAQRLPRGRHAAVGRSAGGGGTAGGGDVRGACWRLSSRSPPQRTPLRAVSDQQLCVARARASSYGGRTCTAELSERFCACSFSAGTTRCVALPCCGASHAPGSARATSCAPR